MALCRYQLLKPSHNSAIAVSLLPRYPSSLRRSPRRRLPRFQRRRLLCTASLDRQLIVRYRHRLSSDILHFHLSYLMSHLFLRDQQGLSSEDTSSSITGDLLDYLNESWTQFHATAEAKRQLIAAGFQLLNENDDWNLQPGGRYFFTRNMSSLIAFAVGDKCLCWHWEITHYHYRTMKLIKVLWNTPLYSVGSGFHVVAAHTDSPCLKLKPRTACLKSGYQMVNVQTYGAGLWHTWFDRDLSVAGRVILKSGDGCFIHRLVKVKRPILRVPTLAIHLDRSVNTDGFKPNLESHLVPLLATKFEESHAKSEEKPLQPGSSKGAHHSLLLEVLSEELDCKVNEILSIELNVCDTQPSCLGGGKNEFIFSGRLDNLASSYCSLKALVDSCKSPFDLADQTAIRMVALFDNEEVGSNSVHGAGAPTMFQAMRRIVNCLASDNSGECAFELSADMAHGVHPNFSDKYEEHHRPELQKGLVIKHNANQRYATSAVTAFLLKELANIHKIPVQEFVVRNDMGCGSTIGPILASGVGIRTVDCGIPQLSMHRLHYQTFFP
ncbi:putative aspartyl aminopeptidase [Apostasia shenzhenica]|uniref:aspartyl aminopeptidase n=1 Tax=Apostasia shenzhenica TaxID=1088818 RepID=A0A2I0AP79_9ASPA|nr:putative aspartyl aminopeptidase [Apostasia shenzhenica]